MCTSRDRSLPCLLRLRICLWREDQIQSLTSSSLFGHSSQKGGENFEGELWKSLHSVRGSIGLGLETLVIGSQAVCLCLFLAFITTGFMFMLLLLLFKTSIYSVFNFNLYSVCFVYLIAL